MKKSKNAILFIIIVLSIMSCGKQQPRAIIVTEYGSIKIELFKSTPTHTENFVNLVESRFYDSLTFHRIVPHYLIQGGDPNSRDASPNARLGTGGPGYLLPEEIGAPHLYGAVGMARSNNLEKASSGSQFYIITGRKQTAVQLRSTEKKKGIKYSDEQLKIYKNQGGAPQLDMNYTVFGKVIEGMDVVEKIQAEKAKNPGLGKVYMKIRMLN